MSYEQIAGPVITNVQPQPLPPELAIFQAILDLKYNGDDAPGFLDARRLLDAMTTDELASLGVAADALRSLAFTIYWNRTTEAHQLARSADVR